MPRVRVPFPAPDKIRRLYPAGKVFFIVNRQLFTPPPDASCYYKLTSAIRKAYNVLRLSKRGRRSFDGGIVGCDALGCAFFWLFCPAQQRGGTRIGPLL